MRRTIRRGLVAIGAAVVATVAALSPVSPASAGTTGGVNRLGVSISVSDGTFPGSGYVWRTVRTTSGGTTCATIRYWAHSAADPQGGRWENAYAYRGQSNLALFSPFFPAAVVIHGCDIPPGGVPFDRWYAVYYINPLGQGNTTQYIS